VQRRFRLTRSEDFERARRLGKSYSHRLVVLVAYESDENHARVGVAAGRRVGSAVKRNRAKRLLRAAIHAFLPRLKPGWDVVLIARPPLASADQASVRETLLMLLHRAALVIAE